VDDEVGGDGLVRIPGGAAVGLFDLGGEVRRRGGDRSEKEERQQEERDSVGVGGVAAYGYSFLGGVRGNQTVGIGSFVGRRSMALKLARLTFRCGEDPMRITPGSNDR